MTSNNSTIWMGNIESWMDEAYLDSFLAELRIYPSKINIIRKENKRGCAFLDFDNAKTATSILKNYNGKKHKNIYLKFNYVRSNERTKEEKQNKKYTIFVGNLSQDTTKEELLSYFKLRYPSVTNAKIIYDIYSKQSKCFGFIDFTESSDFKKALYGKFDHCIKNHHLIINTAKGRSDYSENNLNESSQSLSTTQASDKTQSSSGNISPNTIKTDSSYSLIEFSNHDVCIKERKPKYNVNEYHSKNKEFEKELQKGFRTVVDIIKGSYYNPQESNQCNYYCNMCLLYRKEINKYNTTSVNFYKSGLTNRSPLIPMNLKNNMLVGNYNLK